MTMPAWDTEAPAPLPTPTQRLARWRRLPRLAMVLGLVSVLLIAAVGVLSAELIAAHRRANVSTAALAAENKAASGAAANAEQALQQVRAQTSEAESRASAAEAAKSSAEQAARDAGAVTSQSASDPGIDERFLAELRSNSPEMVSVSDAHLLQAAHQVCGELATLGSSERSMARLVSEGVAGGLTAHQASAVIAGAVVNFCPQYKLNG